MGMLKGMRKVVVVCRPMTSRLSTSHFRAPPFNIMIPVHGPATGNSDDVEFYQKSPSLIGQTYRKDILVEQGD